MRMALRNLRKAPGYSLAAVATLALAIGASTAIFSAVYAVLLKPMPIRDPGRLVVGWGTSAEANVRVIELSYLDIRDIGAAAPAVGRVASHGSSTWTAILDGEGAPVKVPTTGVSGDFFEVMGAAPHLGRMIQPEDDRTTAAPVIVISHATWTRQFGSDPAVIGRRIRLDDQLHEVIGVMPASFTYPQGTDAWRAVAPVLGDPVPGGNPNPMRNIGVLFLIARLNDGVTPAAAAAEWSRVHAQIMKATTPAGVPPRIYDLAVTPFLDHQIGPARQAMWVLFGAVGVLLLIACANVSGLMLTRVSLRHHDDAIRVAVGGSRWAIARLWAAETMWLTAIGGTVGLLTCQWLIAMIVALAPEGIPRLDEVAIDRTVAMFSIAVMAVATLLCAAAPIRQAGIVNLTDTLNDGSRTVAGGRSYRTRSSLLVVQIGLAVVLLVAAGLVVRSFSALQNLDLGFDRQAVLRMKVEPRIDAPLINQWVADLLPQIAALPAVDAAGAVYLTPMEFGSIGHGTWAIAEGQPETPLTAQRNPIVNYLSATPDYFTAMRIPLRRGRMFTADDRASSPRVTLISESTAAAFFPGQDPIGKRFKAASFNDNDRNPQGVWRTVIGVVGNVRYRGLHEVPLDMYDPPTQSTVGTTTSFVIRLTPGQEHQSLAVAAAIQTQAKQRDPRVLISGIMMLEDVVNKEIAPWRFSAWVFALFAGLAFALAMLGLFSLVSLDVANRRREFAIRMAVGATGGHIVSGVFRSAGARAAIGMAAGLAVAMIATRSLQSLLFGVALVDLPTYTAVAGLVAIVVALASYLPARRAALANPIALLRRE
jgi:putative ABC transport system permease protein